MLRTPVPFHYMHSTVPCLCGAAIPAALRYATGLRKSRHAVGGNWEVCGDIILYFDCGDFMRFEDAIWLVITIVPLAWRRKYYGDFAIFDVLCESLLCFVRKDYSG